MALLKENHFLRALLLSLAGWFFCSQANAQEVIAVLSSDSKPYLEALAGFKESYAGSVRVINLAKDQIHFSGSSNIIVTFGGKAALYPYPKSATLIYCLAAAVFIEHEQRTGPRVRIYMAPAPDALLPRFKEIQPNLKRLGVLILTQEVDAIAYLSDVQRAAATNGVELRIEHLAQVNDLPNHLRSLVGQVDALWIPPDPVLITPSTFAAAKEFCRANHIVLYAPMSSLVDVGAVASVSSSFLEHGRTAGRVAAQAVAGTLGNIEKAFPDKYEMVLNLTAATQSGLVIPESVIKKADRIVP